MVKVRIDMADGQKKESSDTEVKDSNNNEKTEDEVKESDSVNSNGGSENVNDGERAAEEKGIENGDDKDEDVDDDEILNAVAKHKESPRRRKRIHNHNNENTTTPTRLKRKVNDSKTQDNEVTSSPKTPKRKHSNTGQMSFRDASLHLLQTTGTPLSAQTLAQRAIDEGLVVTQGKTPDRTIAAMIYYEIRHKPDSPFVLHGPGVFSLKEISGDEPEDVKPAKKSKTTPKKSTPKKRTTPKRKSKSRKDDDDDEEMDDGTKEDADDGDYSEKKTKTTPRKSTPKKRAATPSTDEKKKKKRRISHKDDAEATSGTDANSAKEDDDIDDDLLSAMGKSKDSKDQSSDDNKETRSSKPPSRKQMILNKVKDDKDTKDTNNNTKEEEAVKKTKPQGFKHQTAEYLKYMDYYLKLPRTSGKEEESAPAENAEDQECFVCKEKGAAQQFLLCDFTGCPKVYHLNCVNLQEVPQGDWICPRHYCTTCVEKENKDVEKPNAQTECSTCPNSYCEEHLPTGQLESMIDGSQIICSECKPLFEKMDEEDEDGNKSQENESKPEEKK